MEQIEKVEVTQVQMRLRILVLVMPVIKLDLTMVESPLRAPL